MADKKITQLTNITGANLVDADEFVVVDISADETKAITLGELKEAFDSGSGFVRTTGDTMTGDLALSGADVTFGDNDKAIFGGTTSELQIYSDGSDSRIHDAGTGVLLIQTDGTGVQIKSDGSESIADFNKNGGVNLYYDQGTYSAAKLATTSTGVDITGTLTSDGLTVDGAIAFNSTATFSDGSESRFGADNDMALFHSGGVNHIRVNSGIFKLRADDMRFTAQNGTSNKLTLASNGDLSLYEDTGTTAKFVWDASAESLTLNSTLKVEGGTTNGFLQASGSLFQLGASTASDLVVYTNNTERMRIDGSGNVGIGKVPPTDAHATWSQLFLGEKGSFISEKNNSGGIPGNYVTDNLYIDADTGSFANITTDESSAYRQEAGVHRWYSQASGSAGAAVTLSEKMRIDSSGNVGIGTSSPAQKLTLSGGSSDVTMLWNSTDTAYYNFGIQKDGSLIKMGEFNNDGTTLASAILNIEMNGDKVGIGTISPARDLHINGTAAAAKAFTRYTHDGLASTGLDVGYSSGGYASIYNAENTSMLFSTNATEAMRIDSSGNVAIGLSSNIGAALHVDPATNVTTAFGTPLIKVGGANSWAGNGSIYSIGFGYNNGSTVKSPAEIGFDTTNATGVTKGDLVFATRDVTTDTAPTERMRIDSSGNLLVGQPSINYNDIGGSISAGGTLRVCADNYQTATFNRKTSDGDIAIFFKDGFPVGSIGVYAGDYLTIGEGGSAGVVFYSTSVRPWNLTTNAANDDAIDLGASSARFDDIYATNGTIQTSDRNEKQDIAELTDAEQRVAVAAKGLLRKFRWRDAVAEKGDDARIHFGIIAQDLQDAFTAEGLDAGDYAMFISSTWTDEETGEERTRMGVRYSELLAFIIAAI